MEVRDPETDETRGRKKAKEEETKTFPSARLELTDGKKRGLWREEGRRKGKKGDRQGVSVSVSEWRLSLEGAVRGRRGGTAGTPPPSSPPSPLAPEIRPGK